MSSDYALAADREADRILSDDYRASLENIFPGKGEAIAAMMYDVLALAFMRGADWQLDHGCDSHRRRQDDHPSLTAQERNPTLR